MSIAVVAGPAGHENGVWTFARVFGAKIPLSRNCADKSFVFEGAVSCVFWRWPAGQLWILLGKGGVAAPSKRCCEATKSGADGVVRSTEIVLEFERTTPFLMFRPTGLTLRAFQRNGDISGWRVHPSFAKEYPELSCWPAPKHTRNCALENKGLIGAVP